MAEWISIDERKPDDGQKVLTYSKSGKQNVARYIERMNGFIASGNITVTHWMPLPKAPMKGGDPDGK